MIDQENHHIEVIFHIAEVLSSSVDSGSELHYEVDGRHYSARHVYADTRCLGPEQATFAQVSFLHPATLARSFWFGREVDVYRNGCKVGTAKVTKVVSPQLAGSAPTPEQEAYLRSSPRMRYIVLFSVFYLVLAVPTVLLAISAYTPCVSNFEGGCSMGNGLAAIFSLLPAVGAFFVGIVLMKQLTSHSVIAQKDSKAALAAKLLWLVPLLYILYTLHALF